MRPAKNPPRRWFIYSTAGLFVVLALSLILAAMILLRRGYVTRDGIVSGSSMEPILKGPRLNLDCRNCNRSQVFAWDSCRIHRPFQCPKCGVSDMDPEFDLQELAADDRRLVNGEHVVYAPLRMILAARNRKVPPNGMHSSGLRRGDIVVVQNAESKLKEIKRLVGFPGEQIAIDQGELIVNGTRYKKTLQQTLSQSVLISAWDRTKKVPDSPWRLNSEEFEGLLQAPVEPSDAHSKFLFQQRHWIDNTLPLNAHDTHALMPIEDIGFAIQIAEPTQTWSGVIQLSTARTNTRVHVVWQAESIHAEYNGVSISKGLPTNELRTNHWLVIAISDGDLLVGSDGEEWMRMELANNDLAAESSSHESISLEPASDTSNVHPVSIEIVSGRCDVEQAVIFRDLYYRGKNDTDYQIWDSDDRFILLGDNISCSSDSRDRWEHGPTLSEMKGVVLQPSNPIEVLLRQRR